VVPKEDAVPASRFGDLSQFDEPMGIGDTVKRGKEQTLLHAHLRT